MRSLEQEDITAYMYTGAYHVPSPTLTGSIRDDLLLLHPETLALDSVWAKGRRLKRGRGARLSPFARYRQGDSNPRSPP